MVDSNIGQAQFAQFKDQFEKLIGQLNVGAATNRFGLAQYGQTLRTEISLIASKKKEDVRKMLQRFELYPQRDQASSLRTALLHARDAFSVEQGGRAGKGYEQFLVLVSGRLSGEPVYSLARELKSAGITIVGVKAGATQDELERFIRRDLVLELSSLPTLKKIITAKEELLFDGENSFTSIVFLPSVT